MRRRLLTILATLSLVLWLGQMAILGYLIRTGPQQTVRLSPHSQQYVVRMTPDGLWARATTPGDSAAVSPLFKTKDEADAWAAANSLAPARWHLGFLWHSASVWGVAERDGGYRAIPQVTVHSLAIPHMFISAVLLAAPAIWFLRLLKLSRRHRMAAQGLCPKCGYDLRASPDRCPECGACVSMQSRALPPDPRAS